ncbi:hypothetical protein KUTeg_025023 [Tegillarca granosa]|uniref:Uncharacterized protein n=1 Tax=Tegillarca granosa TaxID=220873 RepID=A0ABQ9DZP5_TEGGR|nr:hypothetical protein KUTeg_025023 [Tegillarca granosa]
MPGAGYSNTTCYRSTLQEDFTHIGVVPFTSGLINGKGHRYPDHGDEPENPVLPLETFTVKYGSSYRFRVINAGMIYAFRVSVDEHQIKLISVDGNDLKVEAAESIIVQPGERIDFILHADVVMRNYWIRAETLEGNINPGKVLGVLHYQGSTENHIPTSKRKKCSLKHRCRVINCPFGGSEPAEGSDLTNSKTGILNAHILNIKFSRYYPKKKYMDCISIADLKSTNFEIKQHPVPRIENGMDLQELFLNFHFACEIWLNKMKLPFLCFQTFPEQDGFFESCEGKNCIDNCCCTNIIKLKKNKTVQLVLYNQDILVNLFRYHFSRPRFCFSDNTLFDMPHPIHMHGHQFHVLKMAFPDYNRFTGAIESPSPDIDCDTPYCNYPTWKNKSWHGDNIPGLNLVNPPLKDTVIVPRYGYVIIRIKADNPGYWIMHCHIEIHQVEGMALVFQEGEKSDMAPVPDKFHKCGDFNWTSNTFRKFINNDINFSDF